MSTTPPFHDDDDAALARIQARNETDPFLKKAYSQHRANEKKMNERMDALWPAQHPFTSQVGKPSLHP